MCGVAAKRLILSIVCVFLCLGALFLLDLFFSAFLVRTTTNRYLESFTGVCKQRLNKKGRKSGLGEQCAYDLFVCSAGECICKKCFFRQASLAGVAAARSVNYYGCAAGIDLMA